MKIKFNKEFSDLVISNYLNGMEPKEIDIKYSLRNGCSDYILNRNKVQRRYRQKLKKVNHNYFDILDTPNKAYFLGFLYADGCIITRQSGQKQMVINLHEQDVEILNKFKKELDFSGDLHFYDGSKISNKNNGYKRSNMYRLTISSDRICDNLIKLGCEPRKTFTCKFPTIEQVPDILMPHFIRGLMDGDGYISSKKNRNRGINPTFTFGIVGTFSICSGVQNYLSGKLNLNPYKKIHSTGNIYGMSYSHNLDVIKIFNHLYPKNCELYLTRKYNKFKEIFNYKYVRQHATYEQKLKSL